MEYDRLCSEACKGFMPSGAREADEEKLLYRICDTVFKYFGRVFAVASATGITNIKIYQANLQRFVQERQAEEFDTLKVAGKHINETLNKAYS